MIAFRFFFPGLLLLSYGMPAMSARVATPTFLPTDGTDIYTTGLHGRDSDGFSDREYDFPDDPTRAINACETFDFTCEKGMAVIWNNSEVWKMRTISRMINQQIIRWLINDSIFGTVLVTILVNKSIIR